MSIGVIWWALIGFLLVVVAVGETVVHDTQVRRLRRAQDVGDRLLRADLRAAQRRADDPK